MVTIKRDTITKSSLPTTIKEFRAIGLEQREAIEKQRASDLKLLLSSEIPEIQALCRLLNVTGN